MTNRALNLVDADRELLEALVLSEQLSPAEIFNLMQNRPDFAEWFTQRLHAFGQKGLLVAE
jgi:hypothetical protein